MSISWYGPADGGRSGDRSPPAGEGCGVTRRLFLFLLGRLGALEQLDDVGPLLFESLPAQVDERATGDWLALLQAKHGRHVAHLAVSHLGDAGGDAGAAILGRALALGHGASVYTV